jgi:hypothetical protein
MQGIAMKIRGGLSKITGSPRHRRVAAVTSILAEEGSYGFERHSSAIQDAMRHPRNLLDKI